MGKKRVRIYKSPDGRGHYKNKLQNFLYLAQEGMSMPAQQQAAPPTPSAGDILKKDFLAEYVYDSLSDDYDNGDIQIAIQQLVKAGHDQNMVMAAVKEAVERKQNDIKATPDEYTRDLNDSKDAARRQKEDAAFREAEEAEEAMIQSGFAEDDEADAQALADEDAINEELFNSSSNTEETEETEETETKQLGGLVKMSLGGPPKKLLELFGVISKSAKVPIKSLDDLLTNAAKNMAASEDVISNYKSVDDLLADDAFMAKVYDVTETELTAIKNQLKQADVTGKSGKLKRTVGIGDDAYKVTQNAAKEIVGNNSFLKGVTDVTAETQKKLDAVWGSGTKQPFQGKKTFSKVSDDQAEINLQTGSLSETAPGVAQNIDDGIYQISEEALGDGYKGFIDDLDNKYSSYFKDGASDIATNKNMAYKGYTATGEPIVAVQRTDGNIINGTLVKNGDNYVFKPILGVSDDLTPIYAKTDNIGVTGNDLVESFMTSNKNKLTNLDDFDQAFKIGEFGPGSKKAVALGEESLITPRGIINDAKGGYQNFSTDYVKGVRDSPVRNTVAGVVDTTLGGIPSTLNQLVRGSGDGLLFGSKNKFVGKYNPYEAYLRSQATSKIQPVFNPTIGKQTYTNPLRGGFGLWGDATKTGADQNWLSRRLGYNQNITGFKVADDARDINTFTGLTPAQSSMKFGANNTGSLLNGATDVGFGSQLGSFLSRNTFSPRGVAYGGWGYGAYALNQANSNSLLDQGYSLQLNPGQTVMGDPNANTGSQFADTSGVVINVPNSPFSKIDIDRWETAVGDITNSFDASKDESLQQDPEMQKKVVEYLQNQGVNEKQLGGTTKAQFVRQGLKEFKKKMQAGGVPDNSAPWNVNNETDVRTKNTNIITNTSKENVALHSEEERLKAEYDALRQNENNMYNNQGMQFARAGAQTKDMKKLGRQLKRTFKRGIPTNLQSFETDGNIFNRSTKATFDTSIPNMNPYAMFGTGGMGMMGGMGNMLGRVLSQNMNTIPTKFRVPLITTSNKANTTTRAEEEVKAQNQIVQFPKIEKWPKTQEELDILTQGNVNQNTSMTNFDINNPPRPNVGETHASYMQRMGISGGGYNGAALAHLVYDGTTFVEPATKQAGGFVDSANPDLYKFTGGGQDFMRYGGIPMANEGIVTGEGDQPLPVNMTNLPAIPAPVAYSMTDAMSQGAPINPYQVENINIDPNMGSPAIVEEASPTIVFNQATGMFEETAPAEQPLVTVAPGEGAAPALLDSSKEAIDLAVSKKPSWMGDIPEDVQAEGASAVESYIKNQSSHAFRTKAFSMSANPTKIDEGGISGAEAQVMYEAQFGQKGNPQQIKAFINAMYNNPNYRNEMTNQAGLSDGTNKLDLKGGVEYISKKFGANNNQIGVNADVNYSIGADGQKSFTPKVGFKFIPGTGSGQQMGGEPELPQNFLGGLGRTFMRGLAGNRAIGRGYVSQGVTGADGLPYMGDMNQNLYEVEKKRRFFGPNTVTYRYGNNSNAGGNDAGGNDEPLGSKLSQFKDKFMKNRPDFNSTEAEEVDDRSRFERKSDRIIDRKQRRTDRKLDRTEARNEKDWEKDRRRTFRKTGDDIGSYGDEQAAREAFDIKEHERRQQELADFAANPVERMEVRGASQLKSNAPTELVGVNQPASNNIGSYRNAFATGVLDNLPPLEQPKSEEELMAEINSKMNVASKFTKSPSYFNSGKKPDPNASTGVGADPNYAAKIEGTYEPNLPNVPMTGTAGASSNTNPVTVPVTDQEMIQRDLDYLDGKQYGGWLYAQGGQYEDEDVYMTDEEIEAFMRAGGVVEFI